MENIQRHDNMAHGYYKNEINYSLGSVPYSKKIQTIC